MIAKQRRLGIVGRLGRIRGGRRQADRRRNRPEGVPGVGPVDRRVNNTGHSPLRSSGGGANHQTRFASVYCDSFRNQARCRVGRIVGKRYRRSAARKLARSIKIACTWK